MKATREAKKSDGMSKESQCRNFQHTTLFRHAGLQEHQMANLCLDAIYPQGYGIYVWGSQSWAWDLKFAGCVSPRTYYSLSRDGSPFNTV